MAQWLEELNPAQREAVTHGEGPLLIVAGAGTGKTRTLACRVAHLIQRSVPSDRILLLTFTRRAAAEMLQRCGRVTGPDATARVWGGTFHAVANRLLRIYGKALDLPSDFTVLDQSDAQDLIHLIRNELGAAKRDRRFPRKGTLLSVYSRMVNAGEPLARTLETYFPWCRGDVETIARIFDGYAQRKRERHLLDYDDLLLFWSALCVTPRVGDAVVGRFDHVLVDEYQDTNPVQAEILRGMYRRCRNICVVGDDAQSIYSFRAATVRNILDFPKQFPGTHTVTLEQNYRSTQPILAASNAVMTQARERYTKELFSDRQSQHRPVLTTCMDEAGQCEAVCSRILEHLEHGVALMNQAVLFRASHHSAPLEVELKRRNIPFRKYGGLKFVETAHIKDLLALLRILENPFDEISWYRVLQLLEGIGARTAGRILDHLGVRRAARPPDENDRKDAAPVSPLGRLFADPPSVPPSAREHFERLRAVLAECCGTRAGNGRSNGKRPGHSPPLATQVERIQAFYEPIFERTYDNAAMRLRDIEQLAHIATGYRSRSQFLTDLTLDPPQTTSDLAQAPFLEEDFLTLSTIHSAKGCEWTAVHIIHAADGMIPSDMAVGTEEGIEEERRLFYVAMTRAKDALYVYFPLRYYHRRFGRSDRHGYAQLTRFLPNAACALFERRTVAGRDDAGWDEAAAATADPYRRVSRLWQT